jgi:type III pantothenate kinase
MLLVFDVGNTETVAGIFRGAELLEHYRIATYPERTVDEMGLLIRAMIRETGFEPDDVNAAAVASVVPPITAVIVEMCERHLGADTYIISASSALPIRLDVEEPLSVGADRIVNTLAATRLYARDTIVVDLGTATTFDCITADGAFVGGVIAPGVVTGAETLVRKTAKLPRVDFERPTEVIGRRTDSALRSGIFFGAVESIDGLVRRIQREWQRRDALVVATGGLATVLGPHCETVAKIEPFLTLFGLEFAHRHLSATQRRGGGHGPRRMRSGQRAG